MKMYIVDWIDAQTSMHALTIEEIKQELKPLHSQSIGFLVYKTKEYIVLGFLDFGNGFIKHHQLIPRKMITKMTELEIKQIKRKEKEKFY